MKPIDLTVEYSPTMDASVFVARHISARERDQIAAFINGLRANNEAEDAPSTLMAELDRIEQKVRDSFELPSLDNAKAMTATLQREISFEQLAERDYVERRTLAALAMQYGSTIDPRTEGERAVADYEQNERDLVRVKALDAMRPAPEQQPEPVRDRFSGLDIR